MAENGGQRRGCADDDVGRVRRAFVDAVVEGGDVGVLAQKQEEYQHAHIAAFYDCVNKGSPNPADIVIGATAALTSILGHEAMSKEKVVNWSDLGVKL